MSHLILYTLDLSPSAEARPPTDSAFEIVSVKNVEPKLNLKSMPLKPSQSPLWGHFEEEITAV